MKKKLFLTALLVFVVACLFAISVSAASYTINYDGKATATTNEDGSITLKDTNVTDLKTVNNITDADGNTVSVTQDFLGWYTDDGRTFEPGETVTFTEDTYLREAKGKVVYNYHDLDQLLGRGWWYIKLGADLELTSKVCTERTGNGAMCILDLNGHNITSTAQTAFGEHRSGIRFVGEGTITHTGSGHLFQTKYHSHGSGNQRLFIGKDVTVSTAGCLFNTTTDLEGYDGIYEVRIYGNATAKNVSNLRKLKNASVTIYEGATLTLTGDKMFVSDNLTGGEHYMTLSLGGTIKFTNPNSSAMFNDFMLTRQFTIAEITQGSFTVSSADSEIIAMFLPETLMLKGTENEDGTTTYNVVEADCVHNWVLNVEQSAVATPGATGLNIYDCSKCGTSKSETTVYSPANVEIEITIDTGDGERTITVLAGDVLDLDFSGTGAAALCTLYGLKDTAEFTADQIVAIEIPAGVSVIGGFANSTLKTINIADGVEADIIATVVNLKGLKTINIGAATVNFVSGLASSTIETISSKVAGANVTFGNSVFKSSKNIKYLEMSAGSKYTFGESSFNATALTELVFPDNSTISWGKNAFQDSTLKYIYIGSNIGTKQIANESAVFDNLLYLEKIVIMDLTLIGKWTLSLGDKISPVAPVLTIYCHSSNISITSEAFNNKKGGRHINFYTVDPDIVNLGANVSSFTIYSGIGHAYTTQTITESTCIEQGTAGYATECPCGIDYRTNTYSIIDSKTGTTQCEPFGTEVVYLPLSDVHVMGTEIADVVYANYFENGTIYYYCSVCNEATVAEEEASAKPVFGSAGYSCFENNLLGEISYTVKVDLDAVSFYEANTGKELTYGLVVGKYIDGNPIIDKNTAQSYSLVSDMSNTQYSKLQIKLCNIDETNMASAAVNMCAYVIQDDAVRYLSDTQTFDTAQSLTFASIKELADNQPNTTVPSDEE